MFVQSPESVRVSAGEQVLLGCQVEAEPATNITWFMAGQPVPVCLELGNATDPCVLFVLGMLLIPQATEEHEGSYTCQAENPFGISIYEVTVSLIQERSEFSQ